MPSRAGPAHNAPALGRVVCPSEGTKEELKRILMIAGWGVKTFLALHPPPAPLGRTGSASC
jgi:hypothetical protein